VLGQSGPALPLHTVRTQLLFAWRLRVQAKLRPKHRLRRSTWRACSRLELTAVVGNGIPDGAGGWFVRNRETPAPPAQRARAERRCATRSIGVVMEDER